MTFNRGNPVLPDPVPSHEEPQSGNLDNDDEVELRNDGNFSQQGAKLKPVGGAKLSPEEGGAKSSPEEGGARRVNRKRAHSV